MLTSVERDACAALIESFDQQYSRFRQDSQVTTLAQTGGPITFPASDLAMWDWYDEPYELSRGAVDPCVGTALDDLGYDGTYSLQPHHASRNNNDGPTENRRGMSSWQAVSRIVGQHSRDTVGVTVPQGTIIDIGAVGKGRLVDLVFDCLASFGHERLTVDAGGDLRHQGSPLTIGLEHPTTPDTVIGVVTIVSGAFCGSANNRRRWGNDLHHMLDARTRAPLHGLVATWCITRTAMIADGMTTLLPFLDQDEPVPNSHHRFLEEVDGWATLEHDGNHWRAGGTISKGMF